VLYAVTVTCIKLQATPFKSKIKKQNRETGSVDAQKIEPSPLSGDIPESIAGS